MLAMLIGGCSDRSQGSAGEAVEGNASAQSLSGPYKVSEDRRPYETAPDGNQVVLEEQLQGQLAPFEPEPRDVRRMDQPRQLLVGVVDLGERRRRRHGEQLVVGAPAQPGQQVRQHFAVGARVELDRPALEVGRHPRRHPAHDADREAGRPVLRLPPQPAERGEAGQPAERRVAVAAGLGQQLAQPHRPADARQEVQLLAVEQRLTGETRIDLRRHQPGSRAAEPGQQLGAALARHRQLHHQVEGGQRPDQPARQVLGPGPPSDLPLAPRADRRRDAGDEGEQLDLGHRGAVGKQLLGPLRQRVAGRQVELAALEEQPPPLGVGAVEAHQQLPLLHVVCDIDQDFVDQRRELRSDDGFVHGQDRRGRTNLALDENLVERETEHAGDLQELDDDIAERRQRGGKAAAEAQLMNESEHGRSGHGASDVSPQQVAALILSCAPAMSHFSANRPEMGIYAPVSAEVLC